MLWVCACSSPDDTASWYAYGGWLLAGDLLKARQYDRFGSRLACELSS
jgi:hypothetical protein